MRELREGVWHWDAVHPEWTHEGKPARVSSYAIDDGGRLLVIDPLAPPTLLVEFASGREPVVLLTCPWHRRDADAVAQRLGAQLLAPPFDSLPPGVEARPGLEETDVVLWIEQIRALVFGDTLVDLGGGLDVAWLRDGQTRAQALDILRPLLDLPVELVLPTHGAPADRAALERALA